MKKLNLSIVFLIITHFCFAQSTKNLNNNWQFTKAQLNEWKSAIVPGTVHQDLMNHSIIGDVFALDAEIKQNWVENSDWEYKNTFQIFKKELENENISLVFEGLDTYCTIYVNDDSIASAENMFVGLDIEVKKYLKEGNNTLKIYFHSATKINRNKAFLHPYNVPAVNERASKSERYSIYSRKAPFHFGWDWGPRIVTSGIWKPVYLNFWNNAKINNQSFELLNLTKKEANYKHKTEVLATQNYEAMLQTLLNNKIISTKKIKLEKGANLIFADFKISNPTLWWSNGLGASYLYTVTSKLILNNKEIATQKDKIGVRTIEIIREKDGFEGKTFKLRLNGIDVFMKGSNYIPGDNLTPRVQTSQYKKVINATKNANMNMLRVWGGGIYENDEFYDLCDENGILIWQDFMFACAMSPNDDKHLKNLESEFVYNVKRMRNHPSLALWCGNNENMENWFRRSWKRDFKLMSKDSVDLMKTYKKIFYELIPNTINKYDKNRFYWPCSPGSEYEISESGNESGDKHNWWIWFGEANFDQIANQKIRFTSEYGLQSYPDLATLMSFARPQDTTFDCYAYDYRQRSELSKTFYAYPNLSKGNELISNYILKYYKNPKNFENFIYLSQAMQGDGLKQISESHRAAKPYTMGSLYWQINDCWPTISWSTIDYFFNWKTSHYAVKQAYKPTIIYSKIDSTSNKINIFLVSDELKTQKYKFTYQLLDFDGKVIKEGSKNVSVLPNTSLVVENIDLKAITQNINLSKSVLYSKIESETVIVAENHLYFKLPKDLELANCKIDIELKNEGNNNYIILKTNTLAKGVALKLPKDEGVFSENYFDLIPNKPKKILLNGDIDMVKLKNELKIMTVNESY